MLARIRILLWALVALAIAGSGSIWFVRSYFGFTRCGDVCPTTLQRLVKMRRAAHASMGQSIAPSSTVLLFDRSWKFTGTITADEPDSSAVALLKQLIST
jgi:cytochrome oxidase Cu insertion factor (SCO1/SenC/PrrC family)